MPVGQSGRTLSGNTGACTRSPLNVEISARMPLRDFLVSALFSVRHRHLLRIRGCFVVRGGGVILAEQVPPPCSNGRRWFEIRGCAILGSAIGSASPANEIGR